mgnify:CR=1 FL=1
MSSAGHLSELESLRSQLADLTRTLAEREQSMQAQSHHLEETMQDLREQSHLLRTITEGTAAETGEEFFASLVTHLTRSLNVQYAIVGEVVGEQSKTVRTLAVSSGGQLVDNFEYGLVQTPCETALERTFACYERGIQDQFPRFARLAELGVEGYCGIPLRTKAGLVKGLLVVMDTKPLRNTERLKSLMAVFASRAGAELQRQQAEAAHRESEHRLRFTQFAVDHAEDGILWADDSRRFMYANEAACRLLGYANKELLTLSISDIAPYHDPTRFQQRLDQIKQGTAAIYESIHRRKDGTEFPIEASVTYLEHEGRGYTCGIVRDITERKRIEQERAQAQADLHNVIEAIPDIVFVLNTQGNMVKWNRRVVDVTGYSHEELLNMPALAFVPPEEAARTADAIQRAFTDGYAELEGHLLTKDHSLIPYHWTGALLKSPHGEPIGITGIGRDVSGKKRAEEALRKSEQRFALAVEGSNDILWDAHRLPGEPWYAPQTPVRWSPRVRKLLGLQESDSFETLEQWAGRLHPDDKDRVFGQLAAHIEQHVPYDVEYRLRTNRGDYRWIRGRGQALWDEQGEPHRMSGSCQDVTEYKQALSRLAEQESLLRAILDAEPECVMRAAADGTLLQMNEAGMCFIETDSFAQVAGRSVYDLVAPEFLERYRSMHEAVLQGATQQLEFQIVGLRGTRRWMETHAVPLRNPIDHRMEHLAITRDITERKRAEKALAESEERYRTVVDLSPNGVVVYSNGKKVYVNQAACRIMGAASPEQLLDNPTFHFSHPDNYESIHASIAQILVTGEPVRRVERKYQRLDGTAISVEVDAGRVMWDGEPAVQVIFADITDRKRAEEALRASEASNISVLNSLSSQIVVLNSQGIIMAVNKPWLRFAEENGAPHLVENFVGINYLNVCAQAPLFANGEEAASAQAGILAVLAGTHNEFSLEYPCHSPDQQRWFRMRVTPLLDSQAGVVVAHENITERKLAQEKRYQSEAQLRAILDNSPSLIFLKDLDGRYLRVNREFTTVFRLTSEEMLGRTDRDIFPPEQAAIFQMNDEKVLQGGMPLLFEEGSFHGDDQRIAIVHKFPLRDKNGTLYAIGGIATDITERKRAEEALREREEVLARFKATLDQTHDCVFMFAPDTLRFLYCNRVAVEQVGYSEVELFTMTPLDLKPELTERIFREMLQPLQDGRMVSHVFETIHRHKDGHSVVVEVSVQLVREEGQDGRFVAVVRDITERKRTEAALRVSEERFDLAVRGSNTGIWDWDLVTGKTYFSPLWKSMLGYEAHELRGEFFEWEERLHPDDRKRSSATVRAYLEGRTPQYELEHRLRHKDGSYRWILARGVSLPDAEGKPYRMAGSHIDITAQKQTQEALAQSERQLRTVLDALPVGVWFTDQSGKPVLANPAAKQIWSGIKRIGIETATNATGWWEAIGPSSELHRWALSHTLTTGVPSLNEAFDLECLDGTKKVIRNSTVPVQDEAGNILGAIVLNEDITLLRQAQEAFRLTQFSVDHAVEGFFWIGPDAKILHVNEAACRMLEYTRDELRAMTLHDIDPNFPPELWSAHWEELKQKGSLTFESKHWSKTGRVLDTEVTANYLQYEGKEYNCAIMRDIGERKRADEVLRSSEERFAKAFRASSHLIGITEIHTGQCIDVNDACLDLFGYRREEVIGQSTITLGLWPHQEDRDRLIETIKADGMVRNLELSFTTKNGEVRQIVISSDPVQINGIPCLLTVGHNVSERKRMEEVLRQREHDLRAAVEERERISQDLHDGILQSLFAVGLGLEAFRLTMSPRIRKTSGPALDQAIDQLNRVMQEIRNFIVGLGSDLLQGKDLPTALQHMLTSLTQNQTTRVRLAVEDRAAQAVSAKQALHLFLVIQEAVSNCIRHGRAPEARVSLKMLKQGVRLSIRDNGRGFNPKAAKGTGHGLRNMADRAQKIGGRFTVLSKVNEGTRIVFDLPVRPGA